MSGTFQLVQGVERVCHDAHRSEEDGGDHDDDDDGEISVARVADNERGGDGMGGTGADLDGRFREEELAESV